MAVRDIVLRDERGNTEAQCRVRFLLHHLALQPLDSLLDHLQVEIQPDGGDMPRLLLAEQIACPTNFQIGGGDAETRS